MVIIGRHILVILTLSDHQDDLLDFGFYFIYSLIYTSCVATILCK